MPSAAAAAARAATSSAMLEAAIKTAIPVDTVVIGAGVVGLAVARALATTGGEQQEVLIVDRASRIGSETSARNSEVLHAGLYYPPSSLKARLCVRGRQMIYEYCRDRSITCQQIGKLVVATDRDQFATVLPTLQEQAQKNGVTDTRLMSAEDVKVMEPQVQSHGALWSPSTGILDSHDFMVNLLGDAENAGTTTLALHTNITNAGIIANNDTTSNNNRNRILLCADDSTWLSCARVVNCAGLWADRIAAMMHSSHTWSPPKQYLAKGNYFRLQGVKSPFSHLIYPVPDSKCGGLGIHATLDTQKMIKFGPDIEWLEEEANPDSFDSSVNPERALSFYDSIRGYWPNLPDGALIPDYSGVRPKLSHPSLHHGRTLPFLDFAIVGSDAHGIPGLVHSFGIESPGLTSSMAIAEYVVELLQRD